MNHYAISSNNNDCPNDPQYNPNFTLDTFSDN